MNHSGDFYIDPYGFRVRPLTENESAQLHAALGPVLHDIRVTGAILPDIREETHGEIEGTISASVYSPLGSGGMGIFVRVELPLAERVADLADQVQEWEVEELPGHGKSSSWPECPDHPNSHPLSPVTRDGQAIWTCPRTGRRIAAIGELD